MPVRIRDELVECEKQALDFLKRSQIADAKVVRTSKEWILFTQGPDEARTAWTAWTAGEGEKRAMVRLDPGFIADY